MREANHPIIHFAPVLERGCWLPGWSVVRDHSLDTKVVRNIYHSAPLIFMGWDVKPATILTPIKIGRIAPTITHFMRIRAPNAATLAPIMDIRK